MQSGPIIPAFSTSDRVAQLVGLHDADAFLRQRKRLELEHLFPLPMPTSHRPLRWRSDEVIAWVARQGRPCPIDLPADPLAAALATGKVALMGQARSA